MNNPLYILSEDLATALIGPFQNLQEAQEHIAFCNERGDGAYKEIISEFVAKRLDPKVINLRLTPLEDRESVVEV